MALPAIFRNPEDLERELEQRVEGRLRLAIRAAVADEVRSAINGGGELSEGLSRRELQVLQAVADGKVGKEIAFTLGISPKTVRNHLSNIFGKLEVVTSPAAVAKGFRLGILS